MMIISEVVAIWRHQGSESLTWSYDAISLKYMEEGFLETVVKIMTMEINGGYEYWSVLLLNGIWLLHQDYFCEPFTRRWWGYQQFGVVVMETYTVEPAVVWCSRRNSAGTRMTILLWFYDRFRLITSYQLQFPSWETISSDPKFPQFFTSYGSYALHGTGTGTGPGNRMGTIENKSALQ